MEHDDEVDQILSIIRKGRQKRVSAKLYEMRACVLKQLNEPIEKEDRSQVYILDGFTDEQLEKVNLFIESFDH